MSTHFQTFTLTFCEQISTYLNIICFNKRTFFRIIFPIQRNENQQRLVQQQKQQLKYKEQMSQQLRQLQMYQMKNSGHMQPPTPQELQLHTQTIMQNAVYKKQVEDQYRTLQNLKIGNQNKFQSYKPNNNFMANQGYYTGRFNYKVNGP